MKIKTMRERLLASSMICGAAFAAVSAVPAYAQDADVSEIVVTGTRIPSPNLESVSPVTAIGSADIKAQGVTRVEDMINTLPQAFAAQGSTVSNGASGTAQVNLRGLGVSRTLVLVDGRRLQPGNPDALPNGLSADLNFVPSSLIERVDVLTGGASAVYGADAIAGVVNFIMQKNFEGVRVDAQYSIYQHDNSNSVADVVAARAATAGRNANQFALPKDNVRDGEGSSVTLTMGVNSADGKGNITAYATYLHYEPILQSNRDYSACTLNSGDAFTCGGSGTAFPARVGGFTVEGNTFRPRVAATDVFNFGPSNYFQRPDDRYSLGAFAHYELAPWAEAYADLMFMDDRSTYQIAAGGIFAGTFSINCDNPLLTATQQGQICGANAGSPTSNFTGTVARRNIEGGGRQGEITHQAYRIVTGLKGDLSDAWNYDFYLQYGTTQFNQKQTGFFQTAKIQNSLIARRNAAGQVVCQSVIDGTDPACVPYNIFSEGGVTDAALDYLNTPSYSTGRIIERVASLSFGGDLSDYGVKSPYANDGVGVAFGAEYRREQLEFSADYVAAAGLLNGSGGASPPVNGSFDTYELYSEARLPLFQDMPFAKSMQLELGYRFSDYSSVGTTHTFKAGGDWVPVDGFRFRGSYQRAVRAPNVLELFSPQNVILDGTTDPCAGLAAGDALVSRCATAFGLTNAQVLAIEANPANQYNGLIGGNPNLDPEKADTYSVGFVFEPTFVPGFNFSVDWFDIKVKNYISGIGADTIINRCVDTLDPTFCDLVNRDAAGSIWLSTAGYVTDTTLNTGSLHTRGMDFNANYRTDLDSLGMSGAGGIAVSFVGTWLDKLETQSLKGGDIVDCAGLYGALCSSLGGSTVPNPEWRHKARITWNTPFSYGEWLTGLGLSAQWRYFSKVDLDTTSSQAGLGGASPGGPATDLKLASKSYFDLLATWTIKDSYSFRLGVNNVFDKDPPLNGSSNCPAGPCNGNTWPQVYDSLGRYIFLGLTADF